MNKMLKRTSILLLISTIIVTFSQASIAETIQVSYKSFYSHVNKLKGEETQALQFAFGFMNIKNKTLCAIKSARISTDKKQIPLSVTAENRFTVPSERALKLADALVVIELIEPANICDMSVQLETKPEFLKNTYTKEEIVFLLNQYKAFFDNMGSFLSFMMPKVSGLSIYFTDNNLQKTNVSGHNIDKGQLSLSEETINKITTLDLPAIPLRITAVTEK